MLKNQPKFYTRVLTKDDFNLIKDLEQIEFLTQKSPWEAQAIVECFDDSYLMIGLFCNSKIIGFSVIYNTKFTTDLLTIGLLPEYQGQKLGFKLLFDTLDRALLNQVQECFLEVRVSNLVAINLYKKFGFKQVGVRKEYYNGHNGQKGEDAYTMHLSDLEKSLAQFQA